MAVNVSFLGECLLAVMFLLCGFAAVLGLVSLKLDDQTAQKILFAAKGLMFGAAGLSAAALILLTAAFLTDDFTVAAVAQYSARSLPFFYKLSAVWAGSAGSLLLWSAGVFVMFAVRLLRGKRSDIRFDGAALTIAAGVCLGFSALLVFVERPFASGPAMVDDGAGLNPLLRNFWMVIHPPLLFVGYSAFSIPFAVTCGSVFTGKVADSHLYSQLRRWLLLGICFLGLGIVTGARWSYVELGWGGYWAWDPVENASLLPWLAAVAGLHSLVGIRFANRFKHYIAILVPVPFILCLVATFITRSGILQSVHSFGQNVMFSALLAFIGCCSLLWLVCSIKAVKSVSVNSPKQSGLDKGEIIFWGNVIFIFTASVIGIATFWPVIWRLCTGSNFSFTLTRQFYDRVISVVGILLAFMVGLAALADLQKRSRFIPKLLGCCAAGLLCFILTFKLSGTTPLTALACGICGFSFAAILLKLALNLKAKGKIAGAISHLGLLILVVTAGISSAERIVQAQLAKGEKISLGGYTIVYDSFEHKFYDDITSVGPEIVVRKEGPAKKLWPHNNVYPDGQSTSEVAVHTALLEDVYISFDGVGQDGSIVITAKVKPLMLWLWFAAVLIMVGPALAMLKAGKKAKSAGPET